MRFKKAKLQAANNSKFWLFTAVTIGCLSLSPILPVVGMVFLILSISYSIGPRLSWFERLIFGYLLAFAINVLVYNLLNFLNFHIPNFHISINVLSSLYILFGGFLVFKYNPPKSVIKTPPSIVTTFVVIFLIAFVVLLLPIKGSSLDTMQLVVYGEDNASHYSLFKHSYLQNDFAYFKFGQSGIIPNLEYYPQGLHLTMGTTLRALIGKSAPDTVLIQAFYAFNAFHFALLIAFIGILGTRFFLSRIKASKNLMLENTGAFLVSTIIISQGTLLTLIVGGFQTQLVAYVFFLALLYVISFDNLFSSKKVVFLITLLLFGGIVNTWWFLLPLSFFCLLIYVFLNRSFLKTLPLLILPPFIFAIFYPIMIYLLFSTDSQHINAGGGVTKLSLGIIIGYSIGALLLVLVQREKLRQFKYIIASIIVSAFITSVLAIYQLITIGELRYYYHKSLYILIPLSSIVLTYFSIFILNTVKQRLGKPQIIFAACLVTAASLTILAFAKPPPLKKYLGKELGNFQNSDFTVLLNRNLRKEYKDMVYAGGCDSSATYVLNRWTGAFLFTDDQWRSSYYHAILKLDYTSIKQLLDHRINEGKAPYLIIKNSCIEPAFIQEVKQKNIKTIVIP